MSSSSVSFLSLSSFQMMSSWMNSFIGGEKFFQKLLFGRYLAAVKRLTGGV
jgi:hypothetical protein